MPETEVLIYASEDGSAPLLDWLDGLSTVVSVRLGDLGVLPVPVVQEELDLVDRLEAAEAGEDVVGQVARHDSEDQKLLALFAPVPHRTAAESGRVVSIDDVEVLVVTIDHAGDGAFGVVRDGDFKNASIWPGNPAQQTLVPIPCISFSPIIASAVRLTAKRGRRSSA